MDEPIFFKSSSIPKADEETTDDDYDDDDDDVERDLFRALANDDKDEFMRLIKDPEYQESIDSDSESYYVLHSLFVYDALKCAVAVLNGETNGLKGVKFEDAGMTPLHFAATSAAPRLTKYLIDRGDDVHALSDSPTLTRATPLDLAIHTIVFPLIKMEAWTPRKSIFELLVHVCKGRALETLRLLAQTQNKDDIKQAFINYAEKGRLVELTSLFLAAPEMFLSRSFVSLGDSLSSFGRIHLVLNSLEKRTEIGEALSLLLDVFALVGDKLTAYVRLHDPNVFDEKELKIAFFLREVAHKKLGVFSADDYLLRFFKPVRPEADQLASYPRYITERQKYEKFEGLPILKFQMKRKDICIDYINRRIPNLEPEEAAILNRLIEDKLSSMSTLYGLFETAKILVKWEKYTPPWYASQLEPDVRLFPEKATSRFGFKLNTAYSWMHKVIKPTTPASFFSTLTLRHISMLAKRLIK